MEYPIHTHVVLFTKLAGYAGMFGVIRPGWGVEGGADAFTVDGHCFYSTNIGVRYPGGLDWEGIQPAREHGERIGMLLDLDQGSTVKAQSSQRLQASCRLVNQYEDVFQTALCLSCCFTPA